MAVRTLTLISVNRFTSVLRAAPKPYTIVRRDILSG